MSSKARSRDASSGIASRRISAATDVVMLETACPLGPVQLFARADKLVGAYLLTPEAKYLRPAAPIGSSKVLERAEKQLAEYFAGTRTDFDLPLAPDGTEFQRRVWRALETIPFGETWSYGELAKKIGNPTASRAVGAANGQNPLWIIVPCHRVIGANGDLTGYAGGMTAKKFLLAHERRQQTLI
ncbi:MAG TPA: methylated-DNA--[protein]-cysteine S-methyltransferase [Kofleriaceae bacterium]